MDLTFQFGRETDEISESCTILDSDKSNRNNKALMRGRGVDFSIKRVVRKSSLTF